MNLKLISLALALAVIAGAHAAEPSQPTAGSALTLEGTLRMKGSLPKTRVVLVREGAAEWDLDKVPSDIASLLENKKVSVTGTVVRPTRVGMLAPSLNVDKLDQVSK
jgi:hypothetical protein